ncbi:uncharacterized protein si:dkeyp-51f12.3 [Osmerus eperlanus]|uniref:uncharacterized protein si:dkeyp-51f12.3 n=1 Tax=Osmerus eperlanus TaxID=29151 RepID=UPI002E14A744
MPSAQGTLLTLGLVLFVVGVVTHFCIRLEPVHLLGIYLGFGGLAMVMIGLCVSMKKVVAVPGHFLLHPRTGTRFSQQQALAIQRRLDRVRREMSEDPEIPRPPPESPMSSTPPPWDMEPPPSYDTVMKNQGHALQQ